jgi:hypothetical protein
MTGRERPGIGGPSGLPADSDDGSLASTQTQPREPGPCL